MTVSGDEIEGLRQQLTAVLVQVATLTTTVTSLREAVDRQGLGQAKAEDRIRGLEDSRSKLAGAYAAVMFLGGAGGAALTLIVQSLQR